jgi:hypothetical protein
MRWAGHIERVRKKIKFIEGFGGETCREETPLKAKGGMGIQR